MSTVAFPESNVDLLEHAFTRCHYRVVSRSGTGPWEYEVLDQDVGAPLRLLVHLLPVRLGERPTGLRQLRARLARLIAPAVRGGGDRLTLLLGAVPESSVLVGWEYTAYRRAPAAPVPRRVIVGAARYGFAEFRANSTAVPIVAFQADQLRTYIEFASDPATFSRRVDAHAAAAGFSAPNAPVPARDAPPLETPTPTHQQATRPTEWAPPPREGDRLSLLRALWRGRRRAPSDPPLDGPASPAPLPRFPRPPSPETEEPSLSPPAWTVQAGAPTAGEASRPVVESGFAPASSPGEPLSPDTPLEPGSDSLFWFGVGVGSDHSIETTSSPLPELVDEAEVAVQLFSFPGELEVVGETHGRLSVSGGGSAVVSRHAATVDAPEEIVSSRLFFRVRAPDKEGDHRLRCNVYLGSTLVQSRVVTARVGGTAGVQALRSDLDYSLSDDLSPKSLERVPPHELSLTVNGDGSSHQFRFYAASGEELLVADSSVEASKIASVIADARAALRFASWGTKAEWRATSDAYRYADGAGLTFEEDLIELARRGRSLYTELAADLVGGREPRRYLERIGRQTGRVQIATTEAGLYVPASLFYDHPLEILPGAGRKYRLCATLCAALERGEALEQLECLQTRCPEEQDEYSVCISGFWGYRFEIGWPVGLADSASEVVSNGPPAIVAGVSTDPAFVLRDDHVKKVLALGHGHRVASRAALTPLLQDDPPHLVYLYCHGGVSGNGEPFIELGEPGLDDAITKVYLVNKDIYFAERQPLIFINGCHTTALEPSQILSLVGGFVKEANAVGVVGTEITIFEPLACTFAESMLGGFLRGTTSIGAAVRHARLELLGQRNPLGLVYVPFVAAATHLRRHDTGETS